MKSILKKIISSTLAVSMLLPAIAAVSAAAEYDPSQDIALSTPDTLKEGNYFFIRERNFQMSESSKDNVYIPIQRTGDLSSESEVTVKLVDMTARIDENYTAKIYGENGTTEDEYGGDSLIDAILEDPDAIEEAYDTGDDISLDGAMMTDANENPIGVVKSYDSANGQLQLQSFDELEEKREENLNYPDNSLRDARNHFIGEVSDRAPIETNGQWTDPINNQMNPFTETQSEAQLAAEEYPGHTFKVHFDANEAAKYLVLTPKYSSKADGDCILMVMLKDPANEVLLHDDFSISNVNIEDVDDKQEVKVNITNSEIRAEDGKAVVEVTREGRINELVTVRMSTSELSAETGYDFSGVDAKIHFPMGIQKREIEIPVLNAEQEKDFKVIITPFTDCTVENSTAHITIAQSKELGDAELQAAGYPTDEPLDLSNSQRVNNCWVEGSSLKMSGKGRNNDEQQIAKIPLHTYAGYFYDGVLVDWSGDISWFSSGWSELDGVYDDPAKPKLVYSGHSIEYYTDPGSSFDETAALFFAPTPGDCGKGDNPVKIWVGCCTHAGRGRDLEVRSVKPILRQWEFVLNPAEKINMRGLTDDEIADLESVVMNSDSDLTSYTAWGNENFSISAAYKPAKLKFKGIEAIKKDNNGNVIASRMIANAASGSSSAIIDVKEDMINTLANWNFIDFQSNKEVNATINSDDKAKGESLKGVIQIRPVFEPIEATVVINSHDYGSFEGLTAGEQKAYYGERLTFKTKLTEKGEKAGVRGVGVEYVQKQSRDGEILDGGGKDGTGKGTNDYIKDESLSYVVNAPYTVYTPTFTESDNKVTVRVKESDLQYFDTSKGLFKGHEGGLDGTTGYYNYIVTNKINPNEVAELTAFTKDENHVPVWTQGSDKTVYSGIFYPLRAGTLASDNVVTLSVERDSSKIDTYALSGAVYVPQMNISTGHTTDVVVPIENAVVSAGDTGYLTQKKGDFTLYPHKYVGGTIARYTIQYNGAVNIDEMPLPDAGVGKGDIKYISPSTGKEETIQGISVDAGMVKIPAYSQNGVHITRATVTQNGIQNRGADAIMMNGKKTVLGVRVDSGVGYVVNEEHRDEKVTGVQFMFINSYTEDIHGVFDAEYDKASDMWKYTIDEFNAEHESDFTYGDVLYAVVTTDREIRGVDSKEYAMTYMPVSTGFAVATDVNYKPRTFEYEMPVDAESMAEKLGGDVPRMDKNEDDDAFIQDAQQKRVTYGQFPFLGEINIMWKIFRWCQNRTTDRANREINEMLNDLDESADSDMSISGAWNWAANKFSQTSAGSVDWTRNIVIRLKDLPYGGTRILFGIGFASGSEGYRNRMNPYQSVQTVMESFKQVSTDAGYYSRMKQALRSDAVFGGPQWSFCFVLGVYIDFGYLTITTTKSDGTTERTHDIIMLGGGGCIGAKLTFGMTTPVMILWVVPGYIGMESSADVTVYIGKSKDPNKSLEQYKNNDGVVLEKKEWNTDIYGHVNGSGIFGVGIDNALGIKTKLGGEIELAYSEKMPKWYPRVAKTGFGAGADLVASGTLEVIGMKIPLASFSYPLPFVKGFMKYFRDVRIGNRTITYVQKGIDDIIREGKESQYKTAIDECRRRISSLELMIDNQEVVIRGAINSLREYAYKNGIIGWYRYYASQCTRLGGLLSLGELTAADMNEDAVNDEGFYVEPAHNSKWVANDNDAELESAFKPVSTHTIMKDAVSQPHSKIINIGNGRMLVVFLMNDPDNTEDPAQMLAYSVYDTKKDEWTEPKFISKDGTTDSIPDLCIGGERNDKVYITWSSLGDTTNIEDPADYLSTSDIYFATFDMAKAKIDDGSIVRLTNDKIYDNNPKIVFDNFSGDIMVTYTKTQQDKTEQFDNNTEKLTNLISPYNNYNTIAYMLYDGEQEKWLTDSYFDTEIASAKTQEEFVEKWQGQRFFDATLQSADGTKTDPAVYDLTTGISGDDGNMILAYTASTGADPTKPEDRDVYVKVYDFDKHIFSEPVRITNDNVAQSMPKIVTTGIDTYLFWYENNKDMMYVDITDLFKDSEIDENGKFINGNIENGTYKSDYNPAIARVSMESVTNDDSFGAMTSYDIYTEMVGEPGDMYENMYIVWSKTVPYYEENEEGEEREASALELFATARIVEKTGDAEIADAEASNKESANATWSQPYRLTSDYMMNDGATAAVDDDGNLVLVHNQYTMTYRGDDQEFMSNPDNVRVITRKNEDGEEQQFLEGDLYETSPVDLVITKCEPCGSLDVDNFSFSDDYPMGGEEITVTAAVENAGLKTAYGAEIEFYEYKDGKRGNLVKKVTTDKEVGVNEAYKTTFTWTMPENTEDIEGLGLVAVMKEKNPDTSGYYEATEAYSDPFKLQSVLETGLEYVEQEGDHFEIAYRVYNSGNKEVEEGTKLNLNLSALYGDAKEVYGVDDTTLKTIDVAGIKPRTDFVKGDELEIPKSVFEYCGYDAIYPEIYNAEGERVAVGEDMFAVFNEPMNFTVNGGKDITLNVGDTITPEVSYSSIDSDGKDINVVYTIDDTSVATVKDGVVTAVGAGETTMTVTLMPYGMEKTVKITVNGENKKHSSGSGGGSGSSNKVSIYQSGNSANGNVSVSNANPAKGDTVTVTVTPKDGFEVDKLTVTDNKGNEIEVIKNDDGTYSFIQPDSKVTVKAEYRKADGTDSDNGSGKSDGSGEKWFKDVPESSWYYAPIKEAFTGGRMAGMSEDYFEPETDITRGMFASAVYRLEGSPETDAVNRFDDVKEGSYYETAIAWATENGIVAGYDDATYGPDDPITREQLAAILYRYANYKSIDVSVGEDTNILDYGDASEISEYAVSAIRWACGAGILTGFEDITLRPQNNANRAQMAVILNKISEIF